MSDAPKVTAIPAGFRQARVAFPATKPAVASERTFTGDYLVIKSGTAIRFRCGEDLDFDGYAAHGAEPGENLLYYAREAF